MPDTEVYALLRTEVYARLRTVELSAMSSMLDTAMAFHLLPGATDSSTAAVEPLALVTAAIGNCRGGNQCGYVFKAGDIVWGCRTCQMDPTCVLCETCYSTSCHEGHDVIFHRTRGGGCCDCGDLEAWKVGGCCPRHRGGEGVCEMPGSVRTTMAIKGAQALKSAEPAHARAQAKGCTLHAD